MQRILILGSPGAGKSTLARRLGQVLGIPVYHLDRYFWKPGWKPSQPDEWQEALRDLLDRDRWILDGNYRSTIPMRLEQADTAVYLDLPRHAALRRVIKRNILNQFVPRPDMAEGCPEPLFDADFLRYVWRFNEQIRPQVLSWLDEFSAGSRKTVVLVRSDHDLQHWLRNLPASRPMPASSVDHTSTSG